MTTWGLRFPGIEGRRGTSSALESPAPARRGASTDATISFISWTAPLRRGLDARGPFAEWQINRNWAAAVEGVQYQVGDVLRRAGGLNANYVNVELKFGW
jgi:hypothetical protein